MAKQRIECPKCPEKLTVENFRGGLFGLPLPISHAECWIEIIECVERHGRRMYPRSEFLVDISENTRHYMEVVARKSDAFVGMFDDPDESYFVSHELTRDHWGFIRDFECWAIPESRFDEDENEASLDRWRKTDWLPEYYVKSGRVLLCLRTFTESLTSCPPDDDFIVTAFDQLARACSEHVEVFGWEDACPMCHRSFFGWVCELQQVIGALDRRLPTLVFVGKPLHIRTGSPNEAISHRLDTDFDWLPDEYAPLYNEFIHPSWPEIPAHWLFKLEKLIDAIRRMSTLEGRDESRLIKEGVELEKARQEKTKSEQRCRPGRRPLSEREQRENLQLVRKWEETVGRRTKDEFCTDEGITQQRLQNALDWHRQRKRRKKIEDK